MSDVEIRSAVTVLGVRYPDRVIDIIAVPYDEEARVLHHGRWLTETVAPGAFAGVSSGVKVYRTHDYERPVGRVAHFHPNDPRGLRTELRIVSTPSGDEALELAAEDLLSASVGFIPLPGGEQYTYDRSRRRIIKAQLDHVALTGDPAYLGAKVLAVRSGDDPPARTPTPLLDQLLAERRLLAHGGAVTAPGAEV